MKKIIIIVILLMVGKVVDINYCRYQIYDIQYKKEIIHNKGLKALEDKKHDLASSLYEEWSSLYEQQMETTCCLSILSTPYDHYLFLNIWEILNPKKESALTHK
jgi:hypothetical protein